MRTKLLFTAFALSALFASCAKEELPVVKMETSERALVENVSFNLTADAATRLTFNGAYVWEAGDQLGACLMDEVIDLDADTWAGKYRLVDYIQTNYKFTRDAEGNWETEAKLCEGNYFLSFPYNANRGLRSAYEFSCAEQTLEGTEKADLMKAFAKNNSFVGYAPIEASNKDHESVAVSMSPVFESTGFTLKNTGTNDYTIEKIVLSGAKVSSYAVVDPTNPNYDVEDNKTVLVYTENGRIDVTLEGGNTVKPQDAINVIVMSGTSALVADNDAVLEIHTNKGLIRGINLNEKQTAMNGKLGEGATVNVLTDKALAKLGAADKVTVTFDDTSIDVPNVMDIYSTDELYRLIEWNSSIKDVAVVANLKADVELTAEMYNILKNSGSYGEDKSTLLIQTAEGAEKVVTVNADVEADAMDLVTFNNVDVVVEGTQSIANAINVDVTVKKGATFDVKAAVAATITNKGTVNANIAYKKNQGTSYYTITKLNNEATVNVAGYALYTELANSTKASVVNVAENTTLTVTGKNYGTINNKGAIEGSLENTAYVNKKYNPTINNYGKIFNVTNNNVIVMMTKDARINAASGEGEIDNTVQSDYIAANVENTVFVKVADLKATELNEIVLNADATKAYISGTLTIDADKEGNAVVNMVKEIETAGNLLITGKGKVYFAASPSFTVAANTETVVDNGSTLSLNTGELVVKGLLTIKNNGKVTCKEYSGNIENYGTLTGTKKN